MSGPGSRFPVYPGGVPPMSDFAPLGRPRPRVRARGGHRPAGRRAGARLPHHPGRQLRLRRHGRAAGQPRHRALPGQGCAVAGGGVDRRPGRRAHRRRGGAVRDPPLRQRLPAGADGGHHRPGPGARRRRDAGPDPVRAVAAGAVVPHAAHRRSDRYPPAGADRQRPPDRGRRSAGAGRAVAGSCYAPTRDGRCGPSPRTANGRCCSASPSGGCRRWCGRSSAGWPP